jgi:hypothetical protein
MIQEDFKCQWYCINWQKMNWEDSGREIKNLPLKLKLARKRSVT